MVAFCLKPASLLTIMFKHQCGLITLILFVNLASSADNGKSPTSAIYSCNSRLFLLKPCKCFSNSMARFARIYDQAQKPYQLLIQVQHVGFIYIFLKCIFLKTCLCSKIVYYYVKVELAIIRIIIMAGSIVTQRGSTEDI